jgi:acetyl-CoA C-acetyltransferase
MVEAAIVAVARSPIGRAFKGSLRDVRPDDLASSVVRAALDKVPQLDPADIDDLMLGRGLPGGEAGFNMGRVVAVLLGFDHLPGTTITRYCASSLQTTPMAMHAIRAGEGEVFVSAGVEVVSRHTKGSSDSLPDTLNPAFDEARARTETAAEGGGDGWHDPRADGAVPDAYIAMGQTAENVARLRGVSRAEQDEFGVRSQNTIDQNKINQFADATHDHQWIHVDTERAARESPAKTTIAHGFLTLSALAGMAREIGMVPDGVSQALNYGIDKARFLAPVRSGETIRTHAKLTSVEKKPAGRVLLTVSCTVEIEGEAKPAVVADLLSLMIPDPSHTGAGTDPGKDDDA